MSTPRKIRIGRDPGSDLVLADRSVSRRHADLLIDSAGAMELLDLGSSSGTFLLRGGKEEEVSRAKLKAGDRIRFGEIELSFDELTKKVGKVTAQDSLPPIPVAKAKPPPLPKKVAAATATAATGGVAVPSSGGRMVRCECGSIKRKGTTCPACNT